MKKLTLRETRSGQADCRRCPLRASVLFAGLDDADLARIGDPIDQFLIKPGTALYHAGDQGDSLFTVRRGTLKLVSYLPDGGQRIVRLVRPTDVLGLEVLVEDRYRHDAIAVHPADICRYPAQAVRTLGRENPKLYRELMARWQRALSEADAWLTELSTGSARQRIARLLLRLGDQADDASGDPHNGGACELFSREDMGAMLGITTETTSRTIADYRRRGLLVEVSPNHFSLDVGALRRIAED